MKKLQNLFIITLLCVSSHAAQHDIPTVDFRTSMKIDAYPNILKNEYYKKLFTYLELLYGLFAPEHCIPFEKPLIRNKFHWIWLGGPNPERHELPEKYRAYQQTWLDMHPDWEFYVWTEADIETFRFINRSLFDNAMNYGEQSDIWRYEILYQEGGVYLDIDEECLKRIDDFNHMYHFYIGIQPLDTHNVQLGIGIIGSIARHPILKECIEQLPLTPKTKKTVAVTGPIFFTKIFTRKAGQTGLRDIALPPSYFYPCDYEQKGMPSELWCKPESYAVHHWAGSWLAPEALCPLARREGL